ncbi:Utp14 protein-domain-containing protein [Aspergillus crustosus]
MPRQSTQLKGFKDQPAKKQPTTKRKSGKILNALSIAERDDPRKFKIRRSRLGDESELFKRKRNTTRDDTDEEDDDSDNQGNKRRRTGEDDDEVDSNHGCDGEGHKWKIGVDSDNDSELDSDEAMGSSDEERFEGFTFRGSSTFNTKPKPKAQKPKKELEIDLSEGSVESDADEDMEDEDDDDLGEDAIDLVAAWDMNAAEEAAEAKKATKSKKRAESDESEDISESEDDSDSDEEEESELSVSDDEVDEDGLSKLQSFVDTLNTTAAMKPKRTKSGQEYLNPTEFGLTSERKLTVADLLSSVTDSRLKNSLKHVDSAISTQQASTGIPGKLDAPLARRQQDRLDRAAAYEKSKETLGRWIETVKANRRADHLMFPLPDPDAQMTHRISVIKPQTSLETEIQNILVESGLADAQGKSTEEQVQEFEELEARKLPIEEIRARRAELRKHRDLMFREEVRAKRIKKIKSKSFRRVHRKEQERMEQKERQALLDAGIDLDEQDREANERLRAEARMGNKHKESKWAKSLKQTGRTAWDEDARHGAVELAQREEELRQRIEGKRVTRGDDDYLGSSSESEEEENPWEEPDSDSDKRKLLKKLGKLESGDNIDEEITGPHAKLLSMKFMQNADAARKAQNDTEVRRLNRELQGGEESASEAESEVGRRKFGHTDKKAEKDKAKKQTKRNEFEEAPGSDEEAERDAPEPKATSSNKSKPTTKANDKPITPAKPEASVPVQNNESDAEEENPWLVASSNKNRRSKTDNTDQPIDLTPNTETAPTPAKSSSKKTQAPKTKTPAPRQKPTRYNSNNNDDDETSSDEDSVPVLLKNHDLVKRAFAGDEVVQEFEQEKLDIVQEEGDRVVDETLPGWGSWTGDGMSRKQKKQQQKRRVLTTVKGVKPESRKDYKLQRVIINEKRVKKNNKYLATALPHQFENTQQYERSLRMPIGPEWSTKETFQSSTKPRVMVKQGVIKPMEKPTV